MDDIVQCLVASMRNPNPGRIYNVVDDEPAPSHIVNQYAYRLLKKRVPPMVQYEDVERELSPMLKSFYAECKRVSNSRMKRELGVKLIYPTYREGFEAQKMEEELKQIAEKVELPGESYVYPKRITESPRKGPIADTSLIARLLQASEKACIGIRNKIFQFLWSIFLKLKLRNTMRQSNCIVYLVDNGSVRVGSTLGMRRLASKLRLHTSILGGTLRLVPTSWRYSNRIDPKELDGEKATLFRLAIESDVLNASANTRALILPLFLGPNDVVIRELPNAVSEACKRSENFQAVIAPPLVNLEDNDDTCCITHIIRASLPPIDKYDAVVLVDHGSPNPEVTRVRRALAARLRSLIYPKQVVDASMERRAGAEYAFNEPLLENVFSMGGLDSGRIFVAMAFLFPGNHAGPGGDIETILNTVRARNPNLNITVGPLLFDEENDHNGVLDLLRDRILNTL